MNTIFLILIIVCIILSGFFSGSETGLYRISRVRLRLGAERKKPQYQLLSSVMQNTHALILSLLAGNNIVNYFAAFLTTILFLRYTGDEKMAEVYATAAMTPILFLLGEIIPKNLFYYRADRLLPSLSPLVWFFHRLFTWSGVVAVLSGLSNLFRKMIGNPIETSRAVELTQREQIKQIFHETREEGLVSDQQKFMMDRLVRMTDLPVSSVMIPFSRVVSVPFRSAPKDLQKILSEFPYTRCPVYKDQPGNLIGFIDLCQTLGSGRPFEDLSGSIKPLPEILSSDSVISALNQLRGSAVPIAAVVAFPRGRKQVVGIVTRKDLMEEFTGELF